MMPFFLLYTFVGTIKMSSVDSRGNGEKKKGSVSKMPQPIIFVWLVHYEAKIHQDIGIHSSPY